MRLNIPEPTVAPDPLHQGCSAPTDRMHPTFPKPDIRTGELLVDPEVELKARGFDLQISMYYGTGADVFTEWGYGRSASVSGYLMQLDGPIATITRGDFSQQYFQLVESE